MALPCPTALQSGVMQRFTTTPRLAAILLLLLLSACGQDDDGAIEFWAMGQEGERVRELVPEFERTHPGIRVRVQQIPWSAAHEKLLTAFAGDILPDAMQLGGTWLAEFAALRAIAPLDAMIAASPALDTDDFYAGVRSAQQVNGQTYGLPWYIDTRLLFYRADLLTQAGFALPPRSWAEWRHVMMTLKQRAGADRYAILAPLNEWQWPVILALQCGAGLLRDGNRHADFRAKPFRQAFDFYLDWFRQDWAPTTQGTQIGNLYREFADGYFGLYLSGPWQVGEFRRQLPAALQEQWATAALPAPSAADCGGAIPNRWPGVSLAGGASLTVSAKSKQPTAAFRWVQFLAAKDQQLALFRLSGNLPSRRSTWASPELAGTRELAAFRAQLERAVPTPALPEWERIAATLARHTERAVRERRRAEEVLPELDREVDAILEKRRWLLERHR